MREKDWGKQLFERLSDYEETAPEGLWTDIEARLAAQKSQKHQSARTIPLWVKLTAAAAFVGVLTGNGYLMWMIGCEGPVGDEASREMAETVVKIKKSGTDAGFAMKSEKLIESEESGRLVGTKRSIKSEAVPVLMAQSTEMSSKASEDMGELGNSTCSVNQETVTIPDALEIAEECSTAQPPSKTSEEIAIIDNSVKETEEVLRELDRQIAQTDSRVHTQAEFSLYASNGFSNQSSSNGVLMNPIKLDSYHYDMYMSRTNNRLGNLVFLDNYEERQKHYQPISYGLTVNIPISSRFYVATGLVYTRLRSDFTSVANGYSYQKEQTLYDIGIPVMGQYYVRNWGRLDAYVTMGVQADFNVKTHLVADGVEQKLKKDHLQWSVNTAMGLQYHILPRFAIYAEPGVKYYFDNGSLLCTFFKDKPLNFNLQVGLRLILDGDRSKN